MSSSPSYPCPFCLKQITNPNYGSHILKKHRGELFNTSTTSGDANIKKLSSEHYGNKTPISLDILMKSSSLQNYWCMTCKKCFRHKARAMSHFTAGHPCYGKQKLAMMEMAQEFENLPNENKLYPGVIDPIQQIVWILYDQLDQECRQRADLEKKYEPEYYVERKPFRLETIWSKITKKIPFSIKYEYLKAKFDEEEEQVETPPEPEAESAPEPVAEPVEEPVVNSIVELKIRRKKPTVKKEEELPPSVPAPPPPPAAETPKETEVDALKRLLSEFPVELQNAALSLRPDLQKKIAPPPAPAPVPPPAPTSFSLYAPFSSQTQSPPVLKTTIKRQPKQVTF